MGLLISVPFLFVPLIFLAYAVRFHMAYELIVLAGLIDAFFGSGVEALHYTLVAIGVVAVVEYVRPWVVLYDRGV